MLSPTQLERIRTFADEVASREGCILYDVEFRDGPGRTLRVFIDKDGGGVGIEDCVNVSRGLNLRLDVEDVIPGGAYELEVSSPGLDRKLTQLWHFGKAVGQSVRLTYTDEAGATKSFEGKLTGVDGQALQFENAKGPATIGFANVQKARIVIADVLQKKPAPGKKKR